MLVAAVVQLVIGISKDGFAKGCLDGITIIFAVVIIIAVTVGNDYVKERQFQKLMASSEDISVPVIRSGRKTNESVFDVLVGDIIELKTGDKVPADCLMLEGSDLTTDESNLTGESKHRTKASYKAVPEPTPETDWLLLGGSMLISGDAKAVVLAVGPNSQQGQADSKMNLEDELTPLQGKLEKIANQIGLVGFYVAILTVVASTANLLITNWINGVPLFTMDTLNSFIQFLIVGITIVVVAVPEGLPLAVTISLAFSVMKMKEKKNLVRRLDASETMGGANEICSDKTGTLTKNEMTVVKVYIEEEHFDNLTGATKEAAEILIQNCSCNSKANIIWDAKTETMKRTGHQTECGLLQFVKDNGEDYDKVRSVNPLLGCVSFSSARKRMTSIIQHPTEADKVRILIKGAAEMVLERCTRILTREGQSTLSLDQKGDIQKSVLSHYNQQAYRSLGFAYKDVAKAEFEELDLHDGDTVDALENDLTFLAVTGIQDPLRDEIVGAVRQCHTSGINVRMVTGDNIETARAISLDAGILKQSDLKEKYACMEGAEFREAVGGMETITDKDGNFVSEKVKDEAKFAEIASKLKVLARSKPTDKYLLVTGLKNEGQVVAVTGDGTNDAPALKKADVGFAMGITGTEVAKAASDIILLDDNFASIITAALWGRNIFASIRKFLQFQLTVNCVAMFMAFLGGVVLGESPLNSVQMLWVNLIMDTFAALALATEPPNEILLDDKPHSRDSAIVTSNMWRNIICQSIYQVIILSIMLFFATPLLGVVPKPVGADWTFENGLHYTLIFNTFVFMQIFNEVNARKIREGEINVFKDFFNNWLFLLIEVITIGVQVGMIQVGGMAVKCTPLTWQQHVMCMVIGALSIPIGVCLKMLPRRLFSIQVDESEIDRDAAKRTTLSILRKGTMAKKREFSRKANEKNFSFTERENLKYFVRARTFAG